jgi:serine/threonine protein kinase
MSDITPSDPGEPEPHGSIREDLAREKIEHLFDLLREPATEDFVFQIGRRVGDFEVVRQLGEGGMGTVFLARQISLDRLVGVKTCRSGLLSKERLNRRFEIEAKALARLSHPNVVPVLLVGEHEGQPFLVMEYVAGPSLADVLDAIRNADPQTSASDIVDELLQYGKAPPSTDAAEAGAILDRRFRIWIVELMRRVASGIAAVHKSGVLHRDIKPSNILIDQGGNPKLVDFGLARMDQGTLATLTGGFLGTPAYVSPEQARGSRVEICPASDVFSYGCVLYECLTIQRPFAGSSSAEILKAVLSDDAPLLRNRDKSLPWELEAIVDKCLRKVPAERYQDGTELARDLEAYLQMRPIYARKASWSRRMVRAVRKRPWALTSFGLAIALVVFGIVVIGQGMMGSVQRSEGPQGQTKDDAPDERIQSVTDVAPNENQVDANVPTDRIAKTNVEDVDSRNDGASAEVANRRPSLEQPITGSDGRPSFTAFGQLRLEQDEINLFLEQCKAQKPKLLEELKGELNYAAERMTPAEIVEAQKQFDFLANENVTIVPRLRTASYDAGSERNAGAIFKPASGSYSALLPHANAETMSVIDERSALLKFNNYGPVVLEGIDTQQLPTGSWRSYLLLKHVGTRKVPRAIGEEELEAYAAVGREGFPEDIVLW